MTVLYGQHSICLRRSVIHVKAQPTDAGRKGRMNAISKPCRDERRENILAIARDVFKKEGYAAASMSTIAARVGGSKGTLYNHFRSKSDLFGAVIQNDCERSQASLIGLVCNEADVRKALTTLGKAFLRLMLSDEVIAFHRMVVAEIRQVPGNRRSALQGRPLPGQGPVGRPVRQGRG